MSTQKKTTTSHTLVTPKSQALPPVLRLIGLKTAGLRAGEGANPHLHKPRAKLMGARQFSITSLGFGVFCPVFKQKTALLAGDTTTLLQKKPSFSQVLPALLPPRLSALSGGSRADSTPGPIWYSRDQEAWPAAACQFRSRAFGSTRHTEQRVQPRLPPTPSRQAQRRMRRMVLTGSHAAWALLVTGDARKPQCV